MKAYYPIALNLKGRLVVVVGGGKVAERKVQGLLRAQARVKVISPSVLNSLRYMAKRRKIQLVYRRMRSTDLNSASIIIAATNDTIVNKNVSQWAHKRNILVNVVDQSRLSDFISPAVIRKQKAIIAVYTDGKDPVLSRDLKNFIKDNWDEFISYRHRL